MNAKLRNLGPKSTARLRQVGVHSLEDLQATGAVGAWIRCRRAGFRPGINLLYSLEGALRDCHWQQVPADRRAQLVAEAEAAAQALAPTGSLAAFSAPAGPVRTLEGGGAADGADEGET